MNRLYNGKEQKTFNLKKGDTAYTVSGDEYASIREIVITGRCEEGTGFEAEYVNYDPEFTQADPGHEKSIHTCNLYVAKDLLEAFQVSLGINIKAKKKYEKLVREYTKHLEYLEYCVIHPNKVEVE